MTTDTPTNNSEPIFKDISADDDSGMMEVESLCMNCHEQGVTRLLLTKIPYYRNVIISSFSCEHCGYENNEIQSAESIQDKGVKIAVTIRNKEDLNRQVVRSNACAVRIPSIDFEIPACKGVLTTIESLITTSAEELAQQQPVRRIMEPEVAAKIDEFLEKLNCLAEVKEPFDVILQDPSGNSFIQNPYAPKKDDFMKIQHYNRSQEENVKLGLAVEDDQEEDQEECEVVKNDGVVDFTNEVVTFKVECSQCGSPAESNMKLVDIPHFKQIILMAFNCQYCGYRDNEVKGGTSIEDQGVRLTLHVTDLSDLNRDILKSDTSGLSIPDIDFVATDGTLGGRFTTLEGLIDNILESLSGHSTFAMGDSADPSRKSKMENTLDKIRDLKNRVGWKFVLDDPAGNSYIQNLYAPDDDPELTVERYTRSHEQDEDLGLLDMKTENY